MQSLTYLQCSIISFQQIISDKDERGWSSKRFLVAISLMLSLTLFYVRTNRTGLAIPAVVRRVCPRISLFKFVHFHVIE